MSESERQFLDWLCWNFAKSGERFYPPEETAKECIESLNIDQERNKGVEIGQHTRAYLEAREFFENMEAHGFEPKERAKRHMRESELDLEPIDWTWYDA